MISSGSPAREAGGAVISVSKAWVSAFRTRYGVADESCRWSWYNTNDFSPWQRGVVDAPTSPHSAACPIRNLEFWTPCTSSRWRRFAVDSPRPQTINRTEVSTSTFSGARVWARYGFSIPCARASTISGCRDIRKPGKLSDGLKATGANSTNRGYRPIFILCTR